MTQPPTPDQRVPEASPYGKHLPALDGIRGFAVLAVMCSHLFPGNARGPITHFIQTAFSYGATGVDLFFVLSGFLITGILFDSLADNHFFRKFYARRILRIFPLYYAVLAAYALGSVFFGMHYSGQLWSFALYLQNTALITRPMYSYAGPSLLPIAHFWSLAIEEQFYFVWPLIVYTLRGRRPLLIVCLAFTVLCPVLRAALWLHGWSYHAVHESTPMRADALLAGAALALLLRSPAHNRLLRLAPLLFCLGAVLVGAIMLVPAVSGPAERWWPSVTLSLRYSAFDLLYVGVIAVTLTPGLLKRIAEWSVLRTLGKYSYGLYVLHLILFTYLQEPLRAWVAQHVTANKAAGVFLTGLIGFALSLAAAVLSYRLYEAPFLRLKRFFSYKQQARSNAFA